VGRCAARAPAPLPASAPTRRAGNDAGSARASRAAADLGSAAEAPRGRESATAQRPAVCWLATGLGAGCRRGRASCRMGNGPSPPRARGPRDLPMAGSSPRNGAPARGPVRAATPRPRTPPGLRTGAQTSAAAAAATAARAWHAMPLPPPPSRRLRHGHDALGRDAWGSGARRPWGFSALRRRGPPGPSAGAVASAREGCASLRADRPSQPARGPLHKREAGIRP
jgi:hypothetical protein